MSPQIKPRRRLLVTSIGSLVGQNILDGLAHQRSAFVIVGLNSQPDAASNFLCDRTYTTPLTHSEDFGSRFDAIVAHETPDLIIPGRDDDVVFLAQWASKRSAVTPLVMVGSPGMASMLRDKWLTCQFAKKHGLPFVKTLCAQDGFEAVRALTDAHGWPLVAKPRTGNASRGVVLVGNATELAVAFAWPGYCFQPWLGTSPDLSSIRKSLQCGLPLDWSLPGIEKTSLDGCIAPNGDLIGLFCTHHSHIKMGRSERVQVLDTPQAQSILQNYAQALRADGWRGPFNIQLGTTPDGHLLAFEINGRFTGSSATLRYLGLDFVQAAMAAFVGPLDSNPETTLPVQRVDKRLRDWPMPDLAMNELNQAGMWTRNTE